MSVLKKIYKTSLKFICRAIHRRGPGPAQEANNSRKVPVIFILALLRLWDTLWHYYLWKNIGKLISWRFFTQNQNSKDLYMFISFIGQVIFGIKHLYYIHCERTICLQDTQEGNPVLTQALNDPTDNVSVKHIKNCCNFQTGKYLVIRWPYKISWDDLKGWLLWKAIRCNSVSIIL